MKVRKIGWIGRLLWRNYSPRTQLYIRSGFTVVVCGNSEWPAIITTSGGESHMLRISRNTTISLIDFISRTFGAGDRDVEISPEVAYHPNSEKIEIGDRIVVWRTKRGWSLAKKGEGMPSAELSDSEWRLTRTALERALQDSLESTAISHDTAS
jgi:hypothetical protein